MGKFVARYKPTSLVATVVTTPRSTDLIDTFAPTTAAPVVSVTVPVTVAVTSCARNSVPQTSAIKHAATAKHTARTLFIELLPRKRLLPVHPATNQPVFLRSRFSRECPTP